MKELSDNQILEGLRSPNQRRCDEALRAIYAQCYPVVAAYIAKNKGSKDDMDDLFQDAVLIFYQKVRADGLELQCAVKTFLFGISKNLWLQRLTSKRKKPTESLEVLNNPIAANLLDVLIENDNKRLVASLLKQLGDGCRSILKLYYFDHLRMKEIALALDLKNEQSAKNKKAACMKKLRTLVENSPHLKTLLR